MSSYIFCINKESRYTRDTMKYIDAHCHLNFKIYEADRDDVIQRSREDKVCVVNVGTQQDTSRTAVEIAEAHEHCYAVIGLHPIHTMASFHDHQELGDEGETFVSRGEVFDTNWYRSLVSSSQKVVAIGECGLDYYHNNPETRKVQEAAFRAQIRLAQECHLPLMLHVRPSEDSFDAYFDVLEILKEYEGLRGNVHFFAGNEEIAKAFLALGFYLSFTGVITFAKSYEALVAETPLDRILSETDAPYVTPVPFRGKRNEASHVREVVKKIAEIKGLDEEQVAAQIMQNAKTLFGISV